MNACKSLYVAAGFKEDCINIISQFEILEQLTFHNFCNIWNDMKFSYVFAGRTSHAELVEFAEEALDIAKEFISPHKSFKTIIGGIYLLYGLFFTMPVSQPKIRMVFTDWQNIIKLHTLLCHNKQYDAVYILNQLIEKNAFVYSLSEHESGLENYYLLNDFMRGNSRIAQSPGESREWTKIFNNLNKINKLYLEEKTKLAEFSEHLVPKIYNTIEIQNLMDTVKELNPEYNFPSLVNKNVPNDDSPTTSKNTKFFSCSGKLGSGDDSDTLGESDVDDED
ncbi:hypothetical protein PV327_009366 [Microctonus hyperodae]|uniref:snRNA-activating protein complex subunit 1 n=1 Tax=Microctonus hyperodae TaxID=165561 RepID=A0AA39KVT6_MICHY|nr:hypothetical protein PV327_009366 [Microctonus hyperodae]